MATSIPTGPLQLETLPWAKITDDLHKYLLTHERSVDPEWGSQLLSRTVALHKRLGVLVKHRSWLSTNDILNGLAHDLRDAWHVLDGRLRLLAEPTKRRKGQVPMTELMRILRLDEEQVTRLTQTMGLLAQITVVVQDTEHIQYVTLDQAAAIAGRNKKSLERYRYGKEKRYRDHPLPNPDIKGGRGCAHQWRWDRLRPWLEKVTARILPKKFPSRLGSE